MKTTPVYTTNEGVVVGGTHCHASAVSWPAIIAGAFIAIAVSLILMLLGSSLGLAVSSPWAHKGASAVALTAHAAMWLVIMQWAASAMGGYLTGRLRTRWTNIHGDEVFFRDTAHGLVMWAVATVLTATLLASAAASVVSGGADMAAKMHPMGPPAMSQNAAMGPMAFDYYVDGLFRGEKPAADDRGSRMEAGRILVKDAMDGEYPAEDRDYLTRVVAARDNVSVTDAKARVDNTIAHIEDAKTKAKEAADKARKAAATTAIFTVISMLVGALIACMAAALGGRHRDELYV